MARALRCCFIGPELRVFFVFFELGSKRFIYQFVCEPGRRCRKHNTENTSNQMTSQDSLPSLDEHAVASIAHCHALYENREIGLRQLRLGPVPDGQCCQQICGNSPADNSCDNFPGRKVTHQLCTEPRRNMRKPDSRGRDACNDPPCDRPGRNVNCRKEHPQSHECHNCRGNSRSNQIRVSRAVRSRPFPQFGRAKCH